MPQTAFSTGPKYPTTTTTVNGSGISGAWANPANIFADDGSNATAAFLGPPTYTFELNGATFGFGIPSNAVIDGIKLEMEVPSSTRWFEAAGTVKLKKAGVLVGDNKAGTGSSASNVYTYGGATSLWGTTWTPAQINAANFGFGFDATATSSPNDFTIAIDYVRITVYWHYSVDVAAADVPKRYLYKVFNDNRYLGNLPKVTSKFGYALDINSAGTSINIECGVSADRSALPGDRLVTEAGDPITTENSEYIYTDGQPPLISAGNSVDPTIIQNGNRIQVWEYSYYYPNGKLMFMGQVNRIEAGFGGSAENKIKLLVLSDGIDLDNFIARGSPFSYTNDVSQTSQNTYVTVTQDSKGAGWNRYGQTFVIGAGVTKLGAIRLYVNGVADATITVYDGLSGSAIGSITQAVNTAGIPQTITFGLASLVDVVPGGTYFFTVSVGAGQSLDMGSSNANPYTVGAMYNSSYSGGSGGGGYSEVTNNDLYFITAAGLATTTATYTSKDPTTEMFKPIIDDYRLRGGLLNYSSSSVDATGLSLTATFNTETIFDAMRKVLSLSPTGFYYYCDLGSDIIYFKNTLTTATHKLIKGRHLSKINLIMSIENVKNDLLFSGAETAGTNLYTEYEDQTSQGNYGKRLERKSDNRVSIQATADAIGSSFIAENKDEYYETTVTVLALTMDITLFKPGDTVGLRGFGSFVDRQMMQIVRLEYADDGSYVNLTLGNMPKRFSAEFEKTIRGLIAQQTVANPSAPS
jgi:hypothetical protein